MATKKLLAEQILFRLNGGWPDIAFQVQEEDVYKAIEQKINSICKSQQFAINLPSGETIPDNLMLATYEDVAVTTYATGSAKSVLPAIPISLPRAAGVHEIRPVLNETESGDKILGDPIIPLLSGQSFLLKADSLLNNLMGLFGYEVNGKNIIYNNDLTKFGITSVEMKLVVIDLSLYSITDNLPIPSDYEEQIVNELVVQFSEVLPETGVVNKNTTIGDKA